jgi:hypothetical protein
MYNDRNGLECMPFDTLKSRCLDERTGERCSACHDAVKIGSMHSYPTVGLIGGLRPLASGRHPSQPE